MCKDVLEFINLGNTEIAELLMKSGANVSIHGKYGETASDLAKAYSKSFSRKIKKNVVHLNFFFFKFRQSKNCKPFEGR